MSKIDRLDFSKPPNGYFVWFDDGWSCVCWGLEDGGQAINTPDDNLTEEAATAAAWDHYKARHDPPGMWSGYCAVLPLCDQYRPRMGVSIPGVAHLELYVNAERPGTCEEAKSMGRAAAWGHYVDAVGVADLLDGENGPTETWPDRCAWPRTLRWTAEQRTEIRRLCLEGGDWSEVLRGL